MNLPKEHLSIPQNKLGGPKNEPERRTFFKISASISAAVVTTIFFPKSLLGTEDSELSDKEKIQRFAEWVNSQKGELPLTMTNLPEEESFMYIRRFLSDAIKKTANAIPQETKALIEKAEDISSDDAVTELLLHFPQHGYYLNPIAQKNETDPIFIKGNLENHPLKRPQKALKFLGGSPLPDEVPIFRATEKNNSQSIGEHIKELVFVNNFQLKKHWTEKIAHCLPRESFWQAASLQDYIEAVQNHEITHYVVAKLGLLNYQEKNVSLKISKKSINEFLAYTATVKSSPLGVLLLLRNALLSPSPCNEPTNADEHTYSQNFLLQEILKIKDKDLSDKVRKALEKISNEHPPKTLMQEYIKSIAKILQKQDIEAIQNAFTNHAEYLLAKISTPKIKQTHKIDFCQKIK